MNWNIVLDNTDTKFRIFTKLENQWNLRVTAVIEIDINSIYAATNRHDAGKLLCFRAGYSFQIW